MTEKEVLTIILQRLGPGAAMPAITSLLAGVLLEISSRADFLTGQCTLDTIAGQADYAVPAGVKRVCDIALADDGMLDKVDYRNMLVNSPAAGCPAEYAVRHGRIYLSPVPDGVYTLILDCMLNHPAEFTDILFGPEFHEAIIEGVLAGLWRQENPEKSDSGNSHLAAFHDTIDQLAGNLETEGAIVEYKDV
jgi:hypothetical protein